MFGTFVALGLLDTLLFVAVMGFWVAMIVRYRRRSAAASTFPRCGYCGYDLTGHASLPADELVCPECGHRAAEVGVFRTAEQQEQVERRRSMKWELMLLCLLTALIATRGLRSLAKHGFVFSAVLWLSATAGHLGALFLGWRRMRRGA